MKILTGIVVAVLIAAACLFFANNTMAELPVEKLVIVSKDGKKKHSFDVEIANTPIAREIGLMNREKMEPDHGMLFEMDQSAIARFWMKNTLIPLDMLFVLADGTIAVIHREAAPHDLTPVSSEVPVTGVLELIGGRAAALGIEPGDKVSHPFFASKK